MPKLLKAERRKTKMKTKARTTSKTKAKGKTRAKAQTQTQTKTKTKTQRKTTLGAKKMPVRQNFESPEQIMHDETGPTSGSAAVENKSEQVNAEKLPTKYKLEVDGALKSEYPSQEIAMTVALELKRKFPHIRVAIVDSSGQNRIAVQLPQAAA